MFSIKKAKFLPLLLFVTLAMFTLSVFGLTKQSRVAANEPVFSSDLITVNYTGGTFSINVGLDNDDAEFEYQYWVKSKTQLHEADVSLGENQFKEVWLCLNESFTNEQFSKKLDAQNFQIDGYYYIYVKVNQNGEHATDLYRAVAITETGAYVENVQFNEVDAKDVNYLEVGRPVTLKIVGGGSEFTLSDKSGTYTVSATSSYTVLQGVYDLTITTVDNNKYVLKINGYTVKENYTKILAVTNDELYTEKAPKSNEVELNIQTENIGLGGADKAVIKLNGKTIIENAQLNKDFIVDLANYGADFGVHYISIQLINNGIVEDYFDFYHYWAKDGVASTIELNQHTIKDGFYNISVKKTTGIPEEVNYQFLVWNSAGIYVVKDWSTDDFIDISLIYGGVYKLEVRAKDQDSKTFWTRAFVDIGTDIKSDYKIVITDINGDTMTDYAANHPYIVSVDSDISDALSYKFMVLTDGQYNVENYYSLNNKIMWMPQKTGNFTIIVWVNNYNRYGYADTIITKAININVEKYTYLESVTSLNATDGEISWLAVSGAENYLYKFNDGEWLSTANTTITAPSAMGEHTVYVKATSSVAGVIDSPVSSIGFIVKGKVSQELAYQGLFFDNASDVYYTEATGWDGIEMPTRVQDADDTNNYLLQHNVVGNQWLYINYDNVSVKTGDKILIKYKLAVNGGLMINDLANGYKGETPASADTLMYTLKDDMIITKIGIKNYGDASLSFLTQIDSIQIIAGTVSQELAYQGINFDNPNDIYYTSFGLIVEDLEAEDGFSLELLTVKNQNRYISYDNVAVSAGDKIVVRYKTGIISGFGLGLHINGAYKATMPTDVIGYRTYAWTIASGIDIITSIGFQFWGPDGNVQILIDSVKIVKASETVISEEKALEGVNFEDGEIVYASTGSVANDTASFDGKVWAFTPPNNTAFRFFFDSIELNEGDSIEIVYSYNATAVFDHYVYVNLYHPDGNVYLGPMTPTGSGIYTTKTFTLNANQAKTLNYLELKANWNPTNVGNVQILIDSIKIIRAV